MVKDKTCFYIHYKVLLKPEKEEINTNLIKCKESCSPDTDDIGKENGPEKEENKKYEISRRTTYFQTLFHLIKCHLGSGIFTVGDIFRNHESSLLLGPMLTVCLGIVCICDNHILANCCSEIRRRRQLSYFPTFPETIEWAFQSGSDLFQRCSFTIREVVKGLNIITQIGCCIVYFIFISSSLQTLLQMLSRHGIEMDEHLIIVIIFVPVVLTIFMCNLQFLTLFSLFASIFIFMFVSLTLYIACSDLPPITPRPGVAHWSQIPLFFGTSIYCFEGIAKVLPLHYREMTKPDHQVKQCSLLILLLALVGILFIVIAFICFIKFVDDVADNNFISRLTMNDSQNYLCSEIVHLMIALGLLFSYTLQFHLALILVWPELIREYGPANHPLLAELVLRLLLALATFAAVEVVPCLGVFFSLIGAMCGLLLALLLPPLCDLALHWHRTSRPTRHSFDFLSIFLAITGFFTGMFYIAFFIIKGFPDDLPLNK